jgi:hypothetical protein
MGYREIPYRNTGAINNPILYVTSASPTPTTAISAPLFRPVNRMGKLDFPLPQR